MAFNFKFEDSAFEHNDGIDAKDWLNNVFNRQGITETLYNIDDMINTVQQYLWIKKHVKVFIKMPKNDRELQLLGRAYDIAMDREVRVWDGCKQEGV